MAASPQLIDESMGQEAADGLRAPLRYWAAAAILIGVFMATLDSSIVNIALPTIAARLHTDAATATWAVTAYQMASAATVLTFAALAQRLEPSTVYARGLAAFVAASLACALAPTIGWLVAFRTAQGLACAAIVSVGIGLYRSVVPARLLGSVLGINALVVAAGAAAGPAVGGILLTVADWRALFYVNVPLGAAGWVIARKALAAVRTVAPPSQGAFDWPGAVLAAAAMSLVVAGVDGLGRRSHVGSIVLFSCGALLILAFARVQHAAGSRALLPLDLCSRRFSTAAITSMLAFVAQGSALVALPFLLQTGYGYTPVESGLILLAWPLAVAVAAPLAGRLADRADGRGVATMGLALFALGLGTLAMLPGAGAHPAQMAIIWRAAVAGAGFGLFQTPNNREMLSVVDKPRTGIASGVLATARTLGQSIGAALVAVVLVNFTAAGEAIAKGSSTGWPIGTALWIACASGCAAVALSASRQMRRR
ncbi:MFS transporter [Trinickia symbiotica]|uniref:MFS transporter n=2 Tax=Trinickia symbiotica TaxID=863227 RepID=A0A2N7XA52_9BURK|nr:MFS transporter [Trinickia symbiotica]